MSEPKTYAWYWVSDLTFLSCSSALAGVLGGTPSTSLALASVSLDPTLSCVIIGSLATFSAFWFNEPKGGESGQGTLPEQRTAEEPANLADTGDLAVREDVHVGQECCDAVGGTGNASHSDTIGPDRPAAEILLAISLLGTGSWGIVSLMQHQAGPTYAVKSIDLSKMKPKKQAKIMREKDIHLQLESPFFIRLFGTFLQQDSIYFVMEPGICDLWMVYNRHKEFFCSQIHARFYSASVVCAFQYLHNKGIIYRDLKPENLVLDESGCLKVCDLGFAKHVGATEKTYTFCGSLEYLAPEIINNSGHSHAVDWWALGILIFELMAGRPCFGTEEAEAVIYARVLRGVQPELFPPFMSTACRDVILALCAQDPAQRLPMRPGGLDMLKSLAWFEDFKWDFKIDPPYNPTHDLQRRPCGMVFEYFGTNGLRSYIRDAIDQVCVRSTKGEEATRPGGKAGLRKALANHLQAQGYGIVPSKICGAEAIVEELWQEMVKFAESLTKTKRNAEERSAFTTQTRRACTEGRGNEHVTCEPRLRFYSSGAIEGVEAILVHILSDCTCRPSYDCLQDPQQGSLLQPPRWQLLWKDQYHAIDTEVVCFSIFVGPHVDFGSGAQLLVDNMDEDGNLRGLVEHFQEYFEDPGIKKVFQNYAFDRAILLNHGCRVAGKLRK
ncbi:cGMP-dependent protein kinase, isozyme 2 forms cD5/T2 [Symbiodinium microadriaticum]|uniref:cGMP-dependent protein kinase, isozyme 2 forms cD5/T2 n=1 Tax=Symbiodinium microadriaticum TaxID=2951 RepID=A0A1Q9CUN7_SYMMI|nr:cGMP-dependent protein kinase, isozyme 2 forms cD5/T2 [Symbiodinium microadriaticum]